MSKTQSLQHLLNELSRTLHLEPKMLEQKVFVLWREYLGSPLGTQTVPVSLSNGILKIYTEYPMHKSELLFHKQSILTYLNTKLGEPLVTEFQIEVRQLRAAASNETKRATSEPETTSKKTETDNDPAAPEKLEKIEQTLANVTDTEIKKSLRRLFTTQSENEP